MDSIPVLQEAFDLASVGVVPGGSRRNHEAMHEQVDLGDVDEASSIVLFDAQTSGGLLIAVEREKVDELVGALADRSVPGAVIGALGAGTGRIEVVTG